MKFLNIAFIYSIFMLKMKALTFSVIFFTWEFDKILHKFLRSVLFIASILLIWYGLTEWSGLIAPFRFPSPTETWHSLKIITFKGYGDGLLYQHVLQSVILVTSGFLVSSSLGILLGILMGANKRIEALVNPVFLTLRPVPPLAWIPLAIVWLGLGDAAKIMVIFIAAFIPAVINTYTGVRSIEVPQREAAAMLGIKQLTYYREVILPGALPMIFTGLRLSLQASWTTLVAAELIGATFGLGSILHQAAQDIYPGMILVGMFTVALSGWLMTLILAKAERWAMPWRPI
ncbi:TauC ABC-type nitrate/sulfonate/bicarbonate transport system, permease component [Burkholderiaceae bacterium]